MIKNQILKIVHFKTNSAFYKMHEYRSTSYFLLNHLNAIIVKASIHLMLNPSQEKKNQSFKSYVVQYISHIVL